MGSSLGPSGWSDVGDLPVGHVRLTAAAFHEGVADGAAVTGFGVTNEQPVPLTPRSGGPIRITLAHLAPRAGVQEGENRPFYRYRQRLPNMV
jgi:hypothetical protein